MFMLDSLDTLWVMGLDSEVNETVTWLQAGADMGRLTSDVKFMEATVRALGGLLSAYTVSMRCALVPYAAHVRLLPDNLTREEHPNGHGACGVLAHAVFAVFHDVLH